ncbi:MULTISPECIES: hypothetical protein [Brevibacillus]|uniref:hypothetical protein n=1 Tax=Brevibacillus TaxID=55080 RepID=UPI00362B6930
MLKEKDKHIERNKSYQGKYNLVVGLHYGGNGVAPAHKGCKTSCISSSGDSICGSYSGHKETEIEGTKLYIVSCMETVKCGNH